MKYEYSVSELTFIEENTDLGADFWDEASRYESRNGEKVLVTIGSYDGEKVRFYFKDLQTKKVWLCECIDKFNVSKSEIYLGEYYRRFTGGVQGVCGGYHEETGYQNKIQFENWDQFCGVLKQF